MSVPQVPNGTTADPANAGGANEPDAKELADATVTPETDQTADRLLKESKKFKERALQAERELTAIKAKALEDQGKYKEMYEKTKTDYDNLHKSLMKSQIKTTVAEQAAKAGCLNVDALLKLGDASLLEYDSESQAVLGSDKFVEEAKKTHPYLFNAAKPGSINPTTPGGVSKEKKLSAAEIAKLSPVEKAKIWAAKFG